MAGIYLHIPFCKQACVYCDFHFITSLQRKSEITEAICKEIDLRKRFFSEDVKIRTLYFGGGTPSLLEARELEKILETLNTHFDVDPDAEISLEANPDDLSIIKLTELKSLGINRLSIGIQSFQDPLLKWMNRTHTARQALDCLENALHAGFDNLSADLIFGIPGQHAEDFESDLTLLAGSGVHHASIYSLTVESNTALGNWVARGKVNIPGDEEFERYFMMAHEFLTEKGFLHYEISNYALPGFESKHNSSYWQQLPYLGIGPSAHSFNGIARSWNYPNNSQYAKAVGAGLLPTEGSEILSQADGYHEYLMTSLRTLRGLDTALIERKFGIDMEMRFKDRIASLEEADLLERKDERICLKLKGWLISDSLISDFFLD